ncbi:methyltransferase domain-containing protein [Brevibacillus sp. NPDC058079]|uniref:methyltransferase domain-containing protein n=1 Tax=Brevibacillus sp. NPDC058079 TaxID=3346330 RepID=UPI0036EF8D12
MYRNSSWSFSKEVSEQFDNHVRKSVPFYDLIQSSIASLSDYFVSSHGLIYDLGCATGETIQLIERRHPDKNLRYIGIDSSAEMLEKARLKNCDNQRISFCHAPLEKYNFEEKSRCILSVLTLQFLPIEARKKIIHNIYACLYEGGAFIYVEKTLSSSPIFQDIFTHSQYDIKLESGLSYEEVFRKQQALRGVMVPITVQDNLQILHNAGFHVEIFLKHWQFTGFIAIKPYV